MSEKSLTETVLLSKERQQEIKARIDDIKKNINKSAAQSPYHQTPRLLLATKTRTPEEINFALSLGVDLIGENRVQELLMKYDRIDPCAHIHFIGALQTNKVKYIIDKVEMIESLDRFSLAAEIDKQAAKIGKVMDVLVEVNIGKEASKSGVMPEDLENFVESLADFHNIRLCGLMSIPPNTTDLEQKKQYFQKIMDLYIDISTKKIDNSAMTTLSFGMSSDYALAVMCGSTIVRVGTAAFGERM